MYYIYDKNSEIINGQDTEPSDGSPFCKSNQVFDLDLNRVIVGTVDKDNNLTYYTIKARPAEQLAAKIKDMQQENNTMGQQVSALSLSDAQKNTLIAQLGAQLVQMQLELAAQKGGAAS